MIVCSRVFLLKHSCLKEPVWTLTLKLGLVEDFLSQRTWLNAGQWSTLLIILSVTTLLLIQSSSAAALKPSNTSSLQPTSNPLGDPKSLGIEPSSPFRASIVLGSYSLTAISILMLSVGAIATLASRDYEARIAGLNLHIEKYPYVAIAVIPRYQFLGVTNEVALRCIRYGMDFMARHQHFYDVTVDCVWHEQKVAQAFLSDRASS